MLHSAYRNHLCARKCTVREPGPRESHGKDWAEALKQNGGLDGGVCVFIRFSDEDSL